MLLVVSRLMYILQVEQLVWSVCLLITTSLALESNELAYEDPSSCLANQTYHSLTLSCQRCAEGAQPSRVGCQCKAGYLTVQDNGYYLKDRQEARGLVCKKCGPGKVTTVDGKGCISCQGKHFKLPKLTMNC